MSMYVPEIVEEVSKNAKMLVEDQGKIVRVSMSNGGDSNGYDIIISSFSNNRSNTKLSKGNYNILLEKWNNSEPILIMIIVYELDYEGDSIRNMYYELPKYIEYQIDSFSVYDQKASREYRIYSDNHVEVNYIG